MTEESDKPYFALFDFDLAYAILQQLVVAFDKLGSAPLDPSFLASVDAVPGVYQLFLSGRLSYVGKADNSLRDRLTDHFHTLRGRKNIQVDQISFRCLALHPNWAPLTHESLLIRHYRSGGECEWNSTGIGNHDPGRKREDWEPNQFDTQFPINERIECPEVAPGEYNCHLLLQTIKRSLPYTLRYETQGDWRRGHSDYNDLSITVPQENMTAEDLLKLIVSHLPGWQATFFRSHMILYKESKDYDSQVKVIR